jgi:ribonuclease J
MGATVVYSGITDNLHVSGHGSQQDLLLMMTLTRPKYLLPIGGTYRHMVQYSHLAQAMGYPSDNILLPDYNQTIEVTKDTVKIGPPVEIRSIMVDGLGVGDVGNVVLRDRQHLAEEGIVVVVVEVDQNDLSQAINIDLISRGFVFDKQNTALLSRASDMVKKTLLSRKGKIESEKHVREIVVAALETFLFNETHRRPMVLPVVVRV